MGSPLHCPLSCRLFHIHFRLFCGCRGFCHRTESDLFLFLLEVVGRQLNYPLSCPLFPYMEVVSSPICKAKFPRAAHSVAHVQPMDSEVGSPTPCFVRMGSVHIKEVFPITDVKQLTIIYRSAAGMGYTFQASKYMNGYHFHIKNISMGYLFHQKIYEWVKFDN